MELIDKSAVKAEIERRIEEYQSTGDDYWFPVIENLKNILSFLDTLEVKEVELMMHTIIAECCDWLAICTDLSHDLIEDCRNLMLAVKDEQLKAQKGE